MSIRSASFISLVVLTCLLVAGCAGKKPEPKKAENKPAAGSKVAKKNPADKKTPAETPAKKTSAETPAKKTPAETPAKKTPAETPAKKTTEKTPVKPATAEVSLGSDDLTSGIPGEGKLTTAQIQAWLDDAKNHVVLKVKLPFGLAAGAKQLQIPADNPMTRAKIELGRQLYFDTRLSSDNTVSCASCHHPDEGYARRTQFGVGVGGQTGNRNSPVSYNRILSGAQFWDGRAASLEEQAVGPIANPIEMGNTHPMAVATVNKIEGYRMQFEKIFSDGVTIDNIGKAIATFERAIVTGPSPYDYFEPLRSMQLVLKDDLDDLESLKEDDPDVYKAYMDRVKTSEAHPMSDSAKRGREVFFGNKASCTACHVGANLADEKYHNLGVGMAAEKPDVGRSAVTKEDKDLGAFKTPTIRNVAQTAPYMHDGSQKTLEEVVEWYAKGGHANPHLSKDVKKLDLSKQDKADLVAFMKACTGEFPKVEQGRLPE